MRVLATASVAVALAIAGCGDDETTTADEGFTAPAPGESPTEQIPTLGAYAEAPVLLQLAAVQEVAESEQSCAKVDVEPEAPFYTTVAEAANDDPDTPFRDAIVELCEQE